MQALVVSRLTKRFGKTRALSDLTFTIREGEVVGLVGPNGSGKTTLLSMLLGAITQTGGTYTILGQTGPVGWKTKQLIGSMIDRPAFYPQMSGRQNLVLFARLKGIPEAAADEALAMLGLEDGATRRFRAYSLGMKQRLAVACALMGSPRLVILDEPTNALDPGGVLLLRHIVNGLRERGVTVLLSSHLLTEVEKTATRVLFLRNGVLVHDEELVTRRDVVVEVMAAEPARVADAAASFSAVRHVEPGPAGLTLITVDREMLATLNAHLVAAGVGHVHFAVRSAVLEDVFTQMMDS